MKNDILTCIFQIQKLRE